MKTTNEGSVFVLVMLLVTIALIIAYVVFNNTFIISNTLIFDENAKELNQALEKKADVNLKATIEYYLNGDRDDDNYGRLRLLSIVPEQSDYYNVFWNNSKISDAINANDLNVDLPKIGEVEDGNLFLSVSSDSTLNYNIKIFEFDREAYTKNGALVPNNTWESTALTSTGGYLQLTDHIYLDTSTGSAFNFDFASSDYAVFIKNNSSDSMRVSVKGEENSTGSGIYLNALNESGNGDVLLLANHIIRSEDYYVGEHFTGKMPKREISWYKNCYGPEIINPRSIYAKGTDEECDTSDIIVCTGDNTGYTISACNVGTTISGVDTQSYGNLFQWGNNYGFPSVGALPNTSTGQVNTSGYGPGNYYSSSTFIYSNYNWSSNQNNNLWGGEGDTLTSDGIGTNIDRQGPCADGYHIPSTLEWYGLVKAWFIYRGSSCISSALSNCPWDGEANSNNFNSDLKLPFVGWLNQSNSTIDGQGIYGDYWSSSPYYGNALSLYFYFSDIFPQRENYRAYGYSVRCFRND